MIQENRGIIVSIFVAIFVFLHMQNLYLRMLDREANKFEKIMQSRLADLENESLQKKTTTTTTSSTTTQQPDLRYLKQSQEIRQSKSKLSKSLRKKLFEALSPEKSVKKAFGKGRPRFLSKKQQLSTTEPVTVSTNLFETFEPYRKNKAKSEISDLKPKSKNHFPSINKTIRFNLLEPPENIELNSQEISDQKLLQDIYDSMDQGRLAEKHTPIVQSEIRQPKRGNSTSTKNGNLIILILSSRKNRQQRLAIRDTWGRGHNNYYFVVGTRYCPYQTPSFTDLIKIGQTSPDNRFTSRTCVQHEVEKMALDLFKNYPRQARSKIYRHYYNLREKITSIQRKYRSFFKDEDHNNIYLSHESRKFKDMLFIDMMDTYDLLTEKVLKGFIWAEEKFAENVEFFAKVDDDSYLRIDAMEELLFHLKSSVDDNNKPHSYIGAIYDNAPVHKSGKWAEFSYNKPIYPPYANGCTGYIISKGLIQNFKQKFTHNQLFLYKNEDTSIGIWLDQDEKLKNKTNYFNNLGFGVCNKYNCLRRNEFDPKRVVFGHNFSPPEMRQCFSIMKNRDFLEDVGLLIHN